MAEVVRDIGHNDHLAATTGVVFYWLAKPWIAGMFGAPLRTLPIRFGPCAMGSLGYNENSVFGTHSPELRQSVGSGAAYHIIHAQEVRGS
jgi:hypothetical protein